MKKPKTDFELLDELSEHLVKSCEIIQALQIREALLTITCKEGKKKRKC